MKIKCRFNKLADIEHESVRKWIKSECIRIEDSNDPIEGLIVGKEYYVYGMVFWNNTPWYYICEEDEYEHPIPSYSGFYEIIDPRFSKYLGLKLEAFKDGMHFTEIVFKEWREDELFFEKLLNGKKKEVGIFRKYKKLMEEEFSNLG